MKIFLVRHAQGEGTTEAWQTPQTPLSEKGIKQAEALASLSMFKIIDEIISSHWKRSQQTAEMVGKVINKPVKVLEEIHEKEQSSKIYGLSRTDPLAEKYTKDLGENRNNWNYKWDLEEESLTELANRVIKFKKYLIETYSQKNISIFSHDMFLRILITACALGDNFDSDQFKSMFRSLNIDNTGISFLVYREEQKIWKLWYLNECTHIWTLKSNV